MKALTFSAARGLQLDDSRSEQAEARDNEATVEVIYAGICSTVGFHSPNFKTASSVAFTGLECKDTPSACRHSSSFLMILGLQSSILLM